MKNLLFLFANAARVLTLPTSPLVRIGRTSSKSLDSSRWTESHWTVTRNLQQQLGRYVHTRVRCFKSHTSQTPNPGAGLIFPKILFSLAA
ncbi:hypothetical protein DL96DRAFT_1608827 [Flagelloscypha sp. PMI_526]|nr:hypothetical protein DL96DRAFT_1608827 [Flagelloscypha sp. PMI_526]